jgi:hypothetical protein
MPFRNLFRQAGVRHPVGYSLLLAAGAMIVCMMAAVVISVRASDRAVRESERRQCESVLSDVVAYRLTPPVTEAGKNQLRSKEELLRLWGCPKPSEKELDNE